MNASNTLLVDSSNEAQRQAWDGEEGNYWADHAGHFDQSMAAYHRHLLAAAALGRSDRVLDIGCGTGQTTRDAARQARAGSALGVDLSARMLDCARSLAAAEGLANATFEQADAQVYPFAGEAFDVAISRTGAMFFGDPVAAFANIARALRPRGRLVLVTWQGAAGNEWLREIIAALSAGRDLTPPPADAPGPFALSDPGRVRALLTAGGFTDIDLEPRHEPMWVGHDAEDAHRFLVGLMGWMLRDLDDERRVGALDALRRSLSAHDTGRGVLYESAAWTIQAVRKAGA